MSESHERRETNCRLVFRVLTLVFKGAEKKSIPAGQLSGWRGGVASMLLDVIAGIIVAAISGAVGFFIKVFIGEPSKTAGANSELVGEPLSSLPYYPVRVEDSGRLGIDKPLFMRAVNELTRTKNPKAASDLIYLAEANEDRLIFTEQEVRSYEALKVRYKKALGQFGNYDKQRKSLFGKYRQIVQGIGETFAGTPIEVVLHDTRDPLHSVVIVCIMAIGS